MQPLEGIKVLDFSTLLPGPLCTLLLAEAGAEVVKVERLQGDEMRSYEPRFGPDSVNFALLNRGKKSLAVDLKSPSDRAAVQALIKDADILVEQFRPGVMDRLGLGFDAVAALNPRLIYCSITGYGQTGPKALLAAHDLNFQAQTGMLALTCDDTGAPGLPPALTADLAGGAYPAVMNILLALRQRDRDGRGRHLDIAMADNLFTLMYWGLGNGLAAGQWPRPGKDLVTGGTPRYAIYRTQDNRYLAAAPLEDKFWRTFLELVGVTESPVDAGGTGDQAGRQAQIKHAVAQAIAQQPAAYWVERFAGRDVCVAQIVDLEQAVSDPHFAARGVFDRTVQSGDRTIAALPVPVCGDFRGTDMARRSPLLGQDNADLLNIPAKDPS